MKTKFMESPFYILLLAFTVAVLLVLVSLLKIYIINYLFKKYYKKNESDSEDLFRINNYKNTFSSIVDIILFTFIIQTFFSPGEIIVLKK